MEMVSLAEKLLQYGQSGACPMHMPGHKRNSPFSWMEPFARMDVTEIDGFDNLHGAEGILKDGMERMALLWGSRRSFFLVNGSTCGILAGIRSLTRPGDEILMARNCHKSVYHAVEVNQLKPVYLMPDVDGETGIAGSIRPEIVEALIKAHPKIRLAVLTSPAYEGVISDIASISAVLHRNGIPLMVDEAHGAHLGFSSRFPGGAVRAGADVVVQSLHKTLPSLTQTAAVHVCGERADEEALARELSIFETSSPSYLLMASIDSCVRLLEERGEELFEAYGKRLDRLDQRLSGLSRIDIWGLRQRGDERERGFWGWDRSKLLIGCRKAGMTGPELMKRMRGQYQIELEMALGGYGLAMTSLCDTEEAFDRLAEALWALERLPSEEIRPAIERPAAGLPLREAFSWEVKGKAKTPIALKSAAGRTSAEYVWCYPPGIPMIVPGEVISPEIAEGWREMEERGVELSSTYGGISKGLLYVTDEREGNSC